MPAEKVLRELARYKVGTFAHVIHRHSLLRPDKLAFIYGQEKPLVSHAFLKDQLGAYYALDDFLLSTHHTVNPLSGSASMGYLGLFYGLSHKDLGTADEEHPYGLPSNGYYFFENRAVYDGVRQTVLDLRSERRPFFAYFHLLSTHSSYSPTQELVDLLGDYELLP